GLFLADRGELRLLAVLETSKRDLDRLFLAVAQHHRLDRLVHARVGDDLREIAHFLDVMTVEFHHHVAGLQPGLGGGAVLGDARDQRAARLADAEAFGDRVVDLLDAHADPAAPRLAEFAELGDNRGHALRRNRKADADRAARRRNDRGID